MYTPLIGRRLLERSNARTGRARSAAEFFDNVFHPLVFGDERYLMTAGNSKFGQLVINGKKLRATAERDGRSWKAEQPLLRAAALADFHVAAAEAEEPQMHLVLGGYAGDASKTTTGQTTSIGYFADADEVYLSWIGAAAGVGVAGGLVMLIDDDAVLDAILDGWALYRRLIGETPGMKGNQVETWNGQWLRHRFSRLYDASDPLAFATLALDTKKTPVQLATVAWARLLLALGDSLGALPSPAYVYSIGQMNTTIGFVQLELEATGALRSSYDSLLDFYRRLFGDAVDAVGADALDRVYDAGRGFQRSCAAGSIGLRSFEPRKLADFYPGGRKDLQPKPIRPADAQGALLYQTWIHAMLGPQKTELHSLADRTAERLLDFETGAIGGKTNLKKSVTEVLDAKSLNGFIDGLTTIARDAQQSSKADLSDEDIADILSVLDELVRVAMDLDYERFRLFLTLLRFQVALRRGQSAHAAKSA